MCFCLLFSLSFWSKAIPVCVCCCSPFRFGARPFPLLLAPAAGGLCCYCTCTCVPGFPYQPLRLAVCHSARRLLFRWAWHVWISLPRQPTKIQAHRHTHTRARAPDSRAPIKRLAQGTDREANGRERPCPRTVLAWPAREKSCLLYTSPSPRDLYRSRMPSSA